MVYSSDKINEESIIKYLPLVQSVARKIEINNTNYELDDLINIGFIGLMDAMEKFDEDKKVPFEAYARIRIRGSIIDELRRSGPVSRNRMDNLKRFYEAKSQLEHQLHRTPTEIEICEKMGIDEEDLKVIHETVHHLSNTSLETLIFSQEGEDTELIDMIEDEETIRPEDHFLELEKKDTLIEAIKQLDKRDQMILSLYYVEDLSMKEIGDILDISIPRVSQLHGKILIELREILEPLLMEA